MDEEEPDGQTDRQLTELSFGQVAAVLSALRASNSPTGLARAVSRLLTGAGARCVRVDLRSPVAGEGTTPRLRLAARSVGPSHDPGLSETWRDLGTSPAGAGKPAVLGDANRELAWVVVPLVAEGRPLGALRVAVDGPARPPADLLAFLHHIGSSLALGLFAAQVQEQSEHVSRSLQDSLLPHALPSARWFRLAARYAPATAGLHVGGDWYDAAIMGATLAISVGDVAGHGVEAAARMGQLRSAMSAFRLLSSGPDELIEHLHRLCEATEHFATAICARVVPPGRLLWASAGHFSPIVAHADGSVDYPSCEPSPPLGAGIGGPVALQRYQLSDHDTVLLFTDGLVERRDETLASSVGALGSEIGRFVRAGLGTDALVDRLLSLRQAAGPTLDDIAVLAVQLDLDRM